MWNNHVDTRSTHRSWFSWEASLSPPRKAPLNFDDLNHLNVDYIKQEVGKRLIQLNRIYSSEKQYIYTHGTNCNLQSLDGNI